MPYLYPGGWWDDEPVPWIECILLTLNVSTEGPPSLGLLSLFLSITFGDVWYVCERRECLASAGVRGGFQILWNWRNKWLHTTRGLVKIKRLNFEEAILVQY
ncbi:hypothetical protein STEG23_001221 [Scotinomys teguina]